MRSCPSQPKLSPASLPFSFARPKTKMMTIAASPRRSTHIARIDPHLKTIPAQWTANIGRTSTSPFHINGKKQPGIAPCHIHIGKGIFLLNPGQIRHQISRIPVIEPAINHRGICAKHTGKRHLKKRAFGNADIHLGIPPFSPHHSKKFLSWRANHHNARTVIRI